jgi:hypothetical protein
MLEWRSPFTLLGLFLIVIGAVLLAVPYILKHLPTLERLEQVPWILLYVYRKDDFYFMTSPILLILGMAYLLWHLIRWTR